MNIVTTIDALRVQQTQTAHTDTVAHGAHIPCQEDAPYVTAVCGAVLDWDDRNDGIVELCVVCRDLLTCPVCRAPLRMPA